MTEPEKFKNEHELQRIEALQDAGIMEEPTSPEAEADARQYDLPDGEFNKYRGDTREEIVLEDGKYTLVLETVEGKMRFYALRGGDPNVWRTFIGDKMVLAMFFRIQELEREKKACIPEACSTVSDLMKEIEKTARLQEQLNVLQKDWEEVDADSSENRKLWLTEKDRRERAESNLESCHEELSKTRRELEAARKVGLQIRDESVRLREDTSTIRQSNQKLKEQMEDLRKQYEIFQRIIHHQTETISEYKLLVELMQ